jgi:glutamate N-acetyltransferase/amino-acid N-acetyltransferase
VLRQKDQSMSRLQTTHGVNFPQGYQSAGVYCGIKKPGMRDLALIVSETEATVAGVFTQNRFQAAPVRWSRQVVLGEIARAIVVNSGNANCATDEQGERDAKQMATVAAHKLGIVPQQVIVASTGVIGVTLPIDKVLNGIESAVMKLSEGDDHATAEAILTTDSGVKRACAEVETPAGMVRIGGIAKGAGMIAPNMATMLCFLTTDAEIPAPVLQQCLTKAVDSTFNCITIDGDTSTNDMVILMANGASGVVLNESALPVFQESLIQVCEHLAKRIVRDGEGATKLITVRVQGAQTREDARQLAKTIAESLLVKTAMHGSDPNWGRIVAAAGRSGVLFDPSKVWLFLQGQPVLEKGAPSPMDEQQMSDLLSNEEVEIAIDLGQGDAQITYWTCDLSAEYVKINSAYRT